MSNVNDWLTPDAQALIDKAEAMIPALRARSYAQEKAGQVDPQTIKEMEDAGFFRVMQPKRWGGFEMDPRVYACIQMNLARGDMSTAWIYGVLAVHPWQLALYPDAAQNDVWGKDNGTLISSSYMPVAKVTPVEGGYKVSGRWGFNSGGHYCQWALLGSVMPVEGTPGAFEHVTLLIPRTDYRIEENWDVIGLRATGSNDVVVEDVFVPKHRTQITNDVTLRGRPGMAENTNYIYKIPFAQVFQRAVSNSSIGAVEGAIDTFTATAKTHVGKHGGKTAEDPNAQMATTEAMIWVDATKTVMLRNFGEAIEAAAKGEVMQLERRLMQRSQASLVPKQAHHVVGELLRACGAAGPWNNNAIARYFRDITVGRSHIANNADHYARIQGAVALGLPNPDPFV